MCVSNWIHKCMRYSCIYTHTHIHTIVFIQDSSNTLQHTATHTNTMQQHLYICTHVTDSIENATPSEWTKSRNSNTSVQIQIQTNFQFEFVPRDTEESELLEWCIFGGVAFSVENVIYTQECSLKTAATHCNIHSTDTATHTRTMQQHFYIHAHSYIQECSWGGYD